MNSKKILISIIATLLTGFSAAQSDLIFINGMESELLIDTGINWAGDYPVGNAATCDSNFTAPQDCHQGLDFTANDDSDGDAGFNYTKLDNLGNTLQSTAVDWSCVRDNITGLIWESKVNSVGIHDASLVYKWGGVGHYGNYGTQFFPDWDSLVTGSNDSVLCGFTDWRLPTTTELQSIINFGKLDPAIDTVFFPHTLSENYWSAMPVANNPDTAWVVRFFDGYTFELNRNIAAHVRLVR